MFVGMRIAVIQIRGERFGTKGHTYIRGGFGMFYGYGIIRVGTLWIDDWDLGLDDTDWGVL